jgi:O-antigen/teichoic acid export membrane protein
LPVILFNGGLKHAIIGFTVSSFISFVIAMILKYNPVKQEDKEKSSYSYNDLFKYSLPIMLASIWGMVITSTDQFMISRYFGTVVFAEFANGATKIPFVGMIVGAMSIVLAPIYSKLANDDSSVSKKEIFSLLKNVFEKSIKLVFPVVTFFLCFSDKIMVVIYGDQYEISGIFFSIKVLENYFTLLTFSALILSIGGQKYYFKVHMYVALLIILFEYISIYVFNSPFAIVWISTLLQISKTFLILNFIRKYLEVRLVDFFPLKIILNILPICFLIICGIRYILEKSFNIDDISLLLVSFILYILLFSLWSHYKKLDYYSIVKPLLKKFNKK